VFEKTKARIAKYEATHDNAHAALQHIRDNKRVYAMGATGVSCLAIGTLTGMQLGGKPEMLLKFNPKQFMGIGYKCSQEMSNIVIQAKGNPGDVVMRVRDRATWASKNEMARDLGIARSAVTNYFAGKIPNLNGDTFIELGKAGHVVAMPMNPVA
jgi:hypothetical protein